MFTIPLQVNPQEFDLFVFFEDENISRIKEYDPAEVVKKHLPGLFQKLQIRNVVIGYVAPGEMDAVFTRLQNGEDVRAVLRTLTRGFRYRPDQGDHDAPYLSVKPSKERPQ